MKKKIIALLLATFLVMLSGCSNFGNKLRIGTASRGGVYNEFGSSLAQVINENIDQEAEAKTTAGSAANLRLLSQDYLDFAIAQADVVNEAYNGTGSFKESGAYKGYSAIAGLYTEACQIVVKADSGIASVDELMGKNVSIGEKESGTERNAKQILSVFGLNDSMLKQVNMNYTDSANALMSGEIDAFFCTAGAKVTVIDKLSEKCPINILPVDGNSAQKLKRAYSFFMDYTIPANTYQGQTSDIQTVGVKSILVVSNKVSEDTVEKITSLIFSNSSELEYAMPTDFELKEKTSVEGVPIPFHKGAANYYSSKNINVGLIMK